MPVVSVALAEQFTLVDPVLFSFSLFVVSHVLSQLFAMQNLQAAFLLQVAHTRMPMLLLVNCLPG